MYKIAVKPFAVGLSGSIALLQLIIINDSSLHQIHQQHLAGTETFLHNNFGRINVKHTDFGGKDQRIIIRDHISGRTQTVTVKDSSHHITVTEQNGSRAVPGLHHGCIILIKVLFMLGHGLVI